MTKWRVLVQVEVFITLDDAFGRGEAVRMAMEAASHNRCDPDESSVLDIPGYGSAEIGSQHIVDASQGTKVEG